MGLIILDEDNQIINSQTQSSPKIITESSETVIKFNQSSTSVIKTESNSAPIIHTTTESNPIIKFEDNTPKHNINFVLGNKGDKGEDGLPGTNGTNGKDAYQSYLDTTTDNPVLTEQQWSDSFEIINLIRLFDHVAEYRYYGIADEGSLETDSVWLIHRMLMNLDGTCVTTIVVDVKWSDRLTETYT